MGFINRKCLYSMCSRFTTQDDCEKFNFKTNIHIFYIKYTWSEFCQWIDGGTDPYCNRITCGNGQLPECSNGA